MAVAAANPHYDSGVMLRDAGRHAEAEQAFRRALALDPAHVQALNNLGLALQAQGRLAEAEAVLRRALATNPDHVRTRVNLGSVLLELDRVDEAVAALAEASAMDPSNPKAAYNLGIARQYAGQMDLAADALRQALAVDPGYANAHYALARQGEAEAVAVRRALETAPPSDRATLLFALAGVLDRAGDVDAAFEALDEANALKRATVAFDIAAEEERMEAIAEVFDSALLDRLAGLGAAEARPVFIVGMPRSGSTLVEQILASHPEVVGLGEHPVLGRMAAGRRQRDGAPFPHWAKDLTPADLAELGGVYAASLPTEAGVTRTVDKAMGSFACIGLIHLMAPQAKIIHLTRDPRDTGLSCYFTRFSGALDYAYDLGEFARYWRAYDRLMAHWRRVLPAGRMLTTAASPGIQPLWPSMPPAAPCAPPAWPRCASRSTPPPWAAGACTKGALVR